MYIVKQEQREKHQIWQTTYNYIIKTYSDDDDDDNDDDDDVDDDCFEAADGNDTKQNDIVIKHQNDPCIYISELLIYCLHLSCTHYLSYLHKQGIHIYI